MMVKKSFTSFRAMLFVAICLFVCLGTAGLTDEQMPYCNALLKQIWVEHGYLLLISKHFTWSICQVPLGTAPPAQAHSQLWAPLSRWLFYFYQGVIFFFFSPPLVVHKVLSETTTYFPALRGSYLWSGEDECMAVAVNIIRQVSSKTARDQVVSWRWWLGRGLGWIWSSQTQVPIQQPGVLRGEWWSESIRDLQPWEATGQTWGPWSILMVAPACCWVSADNILTLMLMSDLSFLHQQHLPPHLSSVSWRRVCLKVKSR